MRVSGQDPHHFESGNGRPFSTVGHDVPSDIQDALEFFPKVQAAGGTCTYLITCSEKLAVEWERLGWYGRRTAAVLDWYLAWAAEVDGKPALRKALPAQNVEGKACVFDQQWKVWPCTYDEGFAVKRPRRLRPGPPAERHGCRVTPGRVTLRGPDSRLDWLASPGTGCYPRR